MVEADLFAEMGDVLFVVEREEVVLEEGVGDVRNLKGEFRAGETKRGFEREKSGGGYKVIEGWRKS